MKKFLFKTYSLELKEPFGTAHGTRTHTDGMIVRLEKDGVFGYGECFMPPYYDENQDSMKAFFGLVDENKLLGMKDLDRALDYVSGIDRGNPGAKAAIDIALHDLFGKLRGLSVREMYKYQEFGIQDSGFIFSHSTLEAESPKRNTLDRDAIPTSYTIGIDTLETMVRKAKTASEFKTLKIKLDGKNDIEVVSSIREVTDQELFVDANQAWRDVEEAVMTACELVEIGVALIEQPFPRGESEKAGELRANCAVPVVADEDVQRRSDIKELALHYDGINIKLMKCSGIREGFQMVEEARKHGLKVLLGCMTESSIGISAAAQLAELADWCDLDGNLLITNDTCEGVKTIDGRLIVGDAHGIGITDDLLLREIFKQDG